MGTIARGYNLIALLALAKPCRHEIGWDMIAFGDRASTVVELVIEPTPISGPAPLVTALGIRLLVAQQTCCG